MTRIWRLHSCFGPKRAEGRAVERFAARVAEATAGALRLDVLAFGASGVADADLLRTVSQGGLDMATLYSEYFDRDAPELALCYVQGVLQDPAAHWRALPVVVELYEATFARWRIHPIAPLARPVYEAAVFAPRPTGSLAALAGCRIRVWSRLQVEAFARLGIAAEILPQHAMVDALESGRIDCALYMTEAAPTTRLAAVAPCYAPLHAFSAVPNMLGACGAAWSRLDPQLQSMVAAAGGWIAAETMAEAQAARAHDPGEAAAGAGFARGDRFSAEDSERFRAASLEAWADLADAAGPSAVAARRRTLDALAG